MSLKGSVALLIILALPWIINFAKLTNCDFESSYRCEVIHGAGVVIPPISWISMWFDSDGSKK